jgi:acetyl esterase
MLDPDIAVMLQRIQEGGEPPLFSNTTAEESRARGELVRRKYYPPVKQEVADVADVVLPGPAGNINARIYRPLGGATDNTVVYFHGGGWIIGDLESHDGHTRRIASTSNAVVLHVAYRLAPEYPFPAGLEDCIAATTWAFENIERLGGNRQKIAVAGDSAGGNLAAAVAGYCRDRELPLAAQLLLYPVVDVDCSIKGN